MTDNNEAARARGQALRSRRAARARTIRRGIISGAVALFVAAWLMIAIVLVSGHDPALARKASTTPAATSAASNPTTTITTSTSGATTPTTTSSSTSSSNAGSASSAGNSGASSVTTSQS